MASTSDSLPTDLAAAHAMIIAQREALIVAQAKAQNAEAEARHRALLIEQMKFTIAKLRHEKFGQSAERGVLLEQLEFRLADMEEDASEAETKAQMAAAARRSKCRPSSAAGQRAGRCLNICRANASSILHLRPAPAAAGPCTRSARM